MLKVGDKFERDGREYVVHEAENRCAGCAFRGDDDACIDAPMCVDMLGTVIFVEVKK